MRKLLLFTFFSFIFIAAWGQSKTTQVSYSGYVDGYYVKASGVLEYRYLWVTYPEVRAEFRTLEVTHLSYNGVTYDQLKNRGDIQFPYSHAGYAAKTQLKSSMPFEGFNDVAQNLYTSSVKSTFDFTTPSLKQQYNSKSKEAKEQIRIDWNSKPFLSDVLILELHGSVIDGIIYDIERTLREEEREQEEERLRLEEEQKKKEAEERKRLEEERQKQEAEEQKRLEEERRLAELEKEQEKNNVASSSTGGSKKTKSKKDRNKSKKKDKKEKKQEEKSSKTQELYTSDQLRRFGEAYNKAQQAEARGDISGALYWYKTANANSYNIEVANKIKSLETQQDINTMAGGVAAFATGFNDAFSDLEKGRIKRGTMTSAYHYAESTFEGEHPSKGSKGHMEAHLALDYYIWIVKQKVAWHLGGFGSYASTDKDLDAPGSDENYFKSEKLELGFRSGINLFGFFEVDYLYRGLMLKGEYSYSIPNTSAGFGLTAIDVPYGGKLRFDGGLRAAIYLARDGHFFIRTSAWYVNGNNSGMLTALDPAKVDQTAYTQSKGFRIELVKRPWSFGFFRSSNTYNNFNTNPLTVDTWGIGMLFGGGG